MTIIKEALEVALDAKNSSVVAFHASQVSQDLKYLFSKDVVLYRNAADIIKELYTKLLADLGAENRAFRWEVGKKSYEIYPPTTPQEAKQMVKLRKKLARELLERDFKLLLDHFECDPEGDGCGHMPFRSASSIAEKAEDKELAEFFNKTSLFKVGEVLNEANCKKCGRYYFYKDQEKESCFKCSKEDQEAFGEKV